ncbi:MAG: thioredoxin family protein [Methyloceanibacter sp.]
MQHKLVSRDEWIAARKVHLANEKALTKARDKLSAERRALPWVKVEKDYVFDTLDGKKTLGDLFDGRSQLIVYHFMLGPDWGEGCPSCSYLADHFDGAALHLAHRDVTLVAVSRAPLPEIEAYEQRMGWAFPWVSSNSNDFNFDFHVSFKPEDAEGEVYYNYEMRDFESDEMPGLSVFAKDPSGAIFHTYSAYARGLDNLIGAYNFLDLVPKGRDETKLPWTMAWVRRHDDYEDVKASKTCCASEPASAERA